MSNWTVVKGVKAKNSKRKNMLIVHKTKTSSYADISFDVCEEASWNKNTRFNLVKSDTGLIGLQPDAVGMFSLSPTASSNVFRLRGTGLKGYASNNFVLTMVGAIGHNFEKNGSTFFDCSVEGDVIILTEKEEHSDCPQPFPIP